MYKFFISNNYGVQNYKEFRTPPNISKSFFIFCPLFHAIKRDRTALAATGSRTCANLLVAYLSIGRSLDAGNLKVGC